MWWMTWNILKLNFFELYNDIVQFSIAMLLIEPLGTNLKLNLVKIEYIFFEENIIGRAICQEWPGLVRPRSWKNQIL